MIDIHTHILPGIDDGPQTWEESIAMARMAWADGIKTMVATPHMMPDGKYNNRTPDILRLTSEANRILTEEAIGLKIVAGGEIYLFPEVRHALEGGRLLTYDNQGKYALFEWSATQFPHYAEHVIFDCQVYGVTPIIAHVERYAIFAEQPDLLMEWVERGVLLQVNARSLLKRGDQRGRSSKSLRKMTETLIERRLIHFVASDAHSVRQRPPVLSQAYDRVVSLSNREYAELLFCENPRRMLAGEEVVSMEPVPHRGRRRLLRQLFHFG